MGTGYGTEGEGAAEVTSIGVLLIFSFFFFLTLVPNALELSKTPLKGP